MSIGRKKERERAQESELHNQKIDEKRKQTKNSLMVFSRSISLAFCFVLSALLPASLFQMLFFSFFFIYFSNRIFRETFGKVYLHMHKHIHRTHTKIQFWLNPVGLLFVCV